MQAYKGIMRHCSFGGLHNCQFGVKQCLRNAAVEETNKRSSHQKKKKEKKKELNIECHV